ncbi:MAG: GntR family transcriptional regulator [Burkholderiaceae bacterium]|nr:GntR family transcriptional regulator [Burkholderiaceae bacterium]
MDLTLSRSVATLGSSLQERIRLALESQILSGQRPPGSAIDEKALARDFSASRTPVREALLMLAAHGLVQIVPRSGIYVRKASAAELVATLEALAELESVLARLAARRASPAHCKAMRAALVKTSARARAEDRKGYEAANAVLHEQIYRCSGNPVLVEHVRQVRGRLSAYRTRGFDQPGRLAVSNREHSAIVKAICAGRDNEAADAMRAHITVGGEAMMALVLAAEASAAR